MRVTPPVHSERRRRWLAAAGLGAFAVVAVAAARWTQPSHSAAPPPGSTAPPPAASAGAARAPGGESGLQRFVIDAEASQALYRVGEVFLRFNRPNVAVGATRAITGEILVDPRRLSNSRLGTIRVDISQLTSDEPRRDQAIRERWLESARYPIAEFRADAIEGLPDTNEPGTPVPVTLHGRLRVRGVERPVTFQGSVVLEGDVLRGTARTTLRMTDFGFEPPSILGLLRAEDEAEVQVDIVARRAG